MNDALDLVGYDADYAIKATDEEGGIEGPCAPFHDADRSKMRDRFLPTTNFGRAMKHGADVLMHHSLPMIGDKPNKLADVVLAEASFELRDDALHMKARLPLDTPENREVFADIKAGKYGLSTGSVSHLVRRTRNDDGTHTIDRWPISEVSITPRDLAAHPRTEVFAIKSLLPDPATPTPTPPTEAAESASLVETLERAESAVLWAASRKDLNGSKLAAIKSLTAAVKAFRDSRVDPAKVEAGRQHVDRLLTRFKG